MSRFRVRFLPVALALASVGCHVFPGSQRLSNSEKRLADVAAVECSDIPRELDKVSIPEYRVEPPDVLLIETVRDLRPSDTPLIPGDEVELRASNTLPVDPEGDPYENANKVIAGPYLVEANGTVNLGPEYGEVVVGGLSPADAEAAIVKHLETVVGLRDPRITLRLTNPNAVQPVAGEHLVGPDGTINLGLYGTVHVSGLNLEEVRQVVEDRLRIHVQDPLVRVSVLGFNSKVVYVIQDGGGYGESVVRLPYTGNETVLDVIAQVQGLSDVSSKSMWVARPAPSGVGVAQNLPVDYCAITRDGVTATNYQMFPGDRLYVKADNLITLDNFVGKVLSPVERVFGTIILGTGMVQRLENPNLGGGGGGVGGF